MYESHPSERIAALQHIQTKYHNTPLLQPLQLVLLPLDPPSETRRSRRALKLHPLRQRGESLHPKLPHRPLARHGIQGTNLWAMLLAVSVVTTIQLAQDDKCRRILRPRETARSDRLPQCDVCLLLLPAKAPQQTGLQRGVPVRVLRQPRSVKLDVPATTLAAATLYRPHFLPNLSLG